MPFIRMDVAAYDEIMAELDPKEFPLELMGERPSGGFDYHAASGRFTPEELGPVARLMLEVLVTAGATRFRVRYDGGCDEGFAYPEALLFGEESRPAADVLHGLASPELAARIREAAARNSMWGNATEMYAGASLAQAAAYALDELAGELAPRLLGRGFGTGEGELYGAFTADFKTGELIDDPNAPKPETME
jgi:hypothetical protein